MSLTQKEIEQINLNESPLVTLARKLHERQNRQIEEYIRTHINDKPKYLPKFIWRWMIKKTIKIALPPIR